MPKGAKVLKDLLSHKEKLEKATSSVKLSEECSAIIHKSLPQKEGDPGSFTLPCLIRPLTVKNALADLRASINLMPHSFFQRLGISKLKPTKMSIQLVDRSIKYPSGVCKNLLVKVGKFIFPVNFVILEMDEDELVPIILGRPFLAMVRAVIDVHEGKLSLRVRNETITFNIGKSMKSKHSRDDYLYCADHTAKTETVEPLEWKAPDNRLKPSSIEPPKLELKELPEHLEYTFLQEDNQLPVVISSALSTDEKTKLLEVLRNHKGAIAWIIADIKGIDLSFCTIQKSSWKISLKPVSNLKHGPWVSPVQVVPKKGGMTAVKNEKDELIPQRIVTRWRVCIDYRKLNNVTWKDHFPLPFIDQMLRTTGGMNNMLPRGFSWIFQIPIAPEDQEKTTFTCPYGTFAYKRMPFRLCNAPASFQHCMTACNTPKLGHSGIRVRGVLLHRSIT
ncbi:DNA-directed DNA polymerase [Tanacetum coccineum]